MVSLQVIYRCKILPLGNFATIAIVLNIGMAIMFSTIFLGLHPIVSTLLMVGIMFLLMSLFSSEATFVLTENGITRTLLSQNILFRNQPEKYYSWNDIKAYKNGTDKGRYKGEFQYLEIKFKSGGEWKITDVYGERKGGFDIFQTNFLAQVNKHNEQVHNDVQKQATVNIPAQKPVEIKREKTFYESIFGKLFTIALGIFIALLFLYGKGYMNGSSAFKLNYVLIPGFAYLFYRTFLSNQR